MTARPDPAALDAEADALERIQADLLRRVVDLRLAAQRARLAQAEAREGARVLRQARHYLGASAVEVG